MNRTGGEGLPRQTRLQLEQSYSADLSCVRVHINALPESIGAWAFAFGNDVFVAPALWEAPAETRFRVLAHECAHVLQQREGKTADHSHDAGIPYILDQSLEEQADCAADLAIRGERSAPLFGKPTRRAFRPAIQPLISINGQLVKFGYKTTAPHQRVFSTNLSEKFIRAAGFISGGFDWLDWAANKATRTYAVENELILLLELSEGLHNTPLLRLPSPPLTIHLTRLWELSADDFFNLIGSQGAGAENTNANSVISNHGFQTRDQLNAALQYFQTLAGTGFWTDVTLGDQLSLQKLHAEIQSTGQSKTVLSGMAAFGLAKAQQAREFADCCHFYLAAITSSSGKAAASQAGQIWEEISKFAVRYLNSPNFGPHWHRSALQSMIRNWIETGGQVGFTTVSAAALNILKNSGWLRRSGKSADREGLVAKYMTDAQALLYAAHGTAQGLSQDGEARRFLYQSGGQHATLAIDPYGTATIESFSE